MIKLSRLKKNHMQRLSRLRKNIFADWQQVDLSDPDLIQDLTDAMTYNYPVQIDYDGSGWRNIQPYGWNTSKDGNVLVMCYKDTGEVRSYRLDKVLDMYIDMTANGTSTNDNTQMNNDEETQIYDDLMKDQNTTKIDMPPIPNEKQVEQKPGIFDEELSLLDDQQVMTVPEEQIEEQPEERMEKQPEQPEQPEKSEEESEQNNEQSKEEKEENDKNE